MKCVKEKAVVRRKAKEGGHAGYEKSEKEEERINEAGELLAPKQTEVSTTVQTHGQPWEPPLRTPLVNCVLPDAKGKLTKLKGTKKKHTKKQSEAKRTIPDKVQLPTPGGAGTTECSQNYGKRRSERRSTDEKMAKKQDAKRKRSIQKRTQCKTTGLHLCRGCDVAEYLASTGIETHPGPSEDTWEVDLNGNTSYWRRLI